MAGVYVAEVQNVLRLPKTQLDLVVTDQGATVESRGIYRKGDKAAYFQPGVSIPSRYAELFQVKPYLLEVRGTDVYVVSQQVICGYFSNGFLFKDAVAASFPSGTRVDDWYKTISVEAECGYCKE